MLFGLGHITFIVITLVLIAFGVFMVRKRRPSIERVIRVCLPICVVCEVIKIIAVIEVLPVVEPAVVNGSLVYVETGAYFPHLQVEVLPLELCSLQIVFMSLTLVIKNEEWRRRLYSVIYGTALAGGLIAVFLSNLVPLFETNRELFMAPRVWEFFIYHATIVVVAISIGLDRDTCDLRFRDIVWMLAVTLCLDVLSIYLNSLLAIEVYRDGALIGLAHATNYFSSFNNPLGIPMPDKQSYFTYMAIRFVLGTAIIALTYLPFLRRDRRVREEA